MPDCSGCGSRYQEGDRVCKSCGFKLIDDPESLSGEKDARVSKKNSKASRRKKLAPLPNSEIAAPQQSTGPPAETKTEEEKVTTEPEQTFGARQLQLEAVDFAMGLDDVQLGKGIIKPKAIELGLDGFHFKYEEQPQAIKKGEPFLKEQGAELRAVNPEFAAEMAPGSQAQVDSANSRKGSHSETLEVTGNAYSFKTGAKPTPLTAEPARQPEPAQNSATAVNQDLEAETLDAQVIDSLEAELRDLETVLDEVRQAETELVLEMEATEKLLGNVPEEILSTDFAKADLSNDEAIVTEIVGMVDIPEKVENAPEISEGPVASEPLSANEIDVAVKINDHGGLVEGTQQPGALKTLLQGQQSWYGIPLPYYYQLSERFLVCTDPNGHSIEYDLKMIKKVTVKQSWLGKFLGIGDVVLDFANQVPSRYILAGIVNPARLCTQLEELLQNAV